MLQFIFYSNIIALFPTCFTVLAWSDLPVRWLKLTIGESYFVMLTVLVNLYVIKYSICIGSSFSCLAGRMSPYCLLPAPGKNLSFLVDNFIFSHMCMQNIFNGVIWFVLPVLLVCSNDTFAYICGFFLGKKYFQSPLINLSVSWI